MVAACGLLSSCVDLSQQHQVVGPYFVAADPEADYETLYFDLGNGNGIERVRNVKRVGHTDAFIIAETQKGYYFIDRQKDNKFLNGDDIIGNPKTTADFIHWLDSLKIKDFRFDFYREK